ncbi:MAG TPA: DUF364 domain-containing protein [Bacteroidales bacterium]|nr:DUF364 domain-containing protein [Bacteroidales bacterium]
MIIERTYELLNSVYKTGFSDLTIDDLRIGQFLTAVRLSDGTVGTASSLEDDHPFCTKQQRDFGEFTPLKIKGRSIRQLFESEKDSRLMFSLRMACLNAASSRIISSGKYTIVENSDPLDIIALGNDRDITVVGAFQSYIRKISQSDNRLHVLELNENALRPEQKQFYVPADNYSEVIPKSDIVIITGQTLVNDTLENLLSVTGRDSTVVVTGPTGSMLPDVLFEKGVSIIGATRITKPELVFEVVGQAGLAYHMFEYCAQKICILKG